MPLIGRIAAATARAYGLFSSIAQAVDPYFNYVVALLHGDGTNGGQNNTFLDSSSNNFTITRNGNTTQGSFSPFSQTGWGNYFDGNGDELTLSNTTAAQVGSNDFSIECFVFPTRQTNTYAQGLITYGIVGSTTGTSYIGFQMSPSGYLNLFFAQTASPDLADPNLLPINQWSHVVACRSGSTLSMFVNGLRVATTTTSATVGSSGDRITIGGQWFANASTRQLQGYISNARIVKGSSAYSASSSTLTVPTAPLTAITNTSLLTCQSNRFIDNSTNAFAITANGDVSVQAFSPFNPTTAYSTSSIGGSGYFDGSGDYLTTSPNAAFRPSGNFTIEAWVYLSTVSGIQNFFTTQDGSGFYQFSLGTNGTNARFTMGPYSGAYAVAINGGTLTTGAWFHIAVARSGTGSNNIRMWVNGSSVAQATSNATPGTETSVEIGREAFGGSNPFTGYMGGLRIVTGSAVYDPAQSTITVPTSPLTAVTNTSFLLNFTNGAIFDNAAVADYETVGNAQISTSVKKYGTGSMSFDGTGDYLVTDAPSTNLFAFGTGDFTIEFWIYFNTVSGNQSLVDLRPSGVNGAYPLIYASSTSLTYYVSSASQINGGVMATGIWYHVAISRIASQTKMFLNGTQVGSTYADTNSYLCGAGAPWVGSFRDGTGQLNGYIDDLRISKGVGRYQYNFTPPTAAFPNIGGTVTLTADPYYEYTTLLLPGNGTNGAQNNTFLDSSTNAFTITRNGNTTQGTFSPFSQTGWSNYFDGTGDYLSATSNAAFGMGSGDYTIECWLYLTGTPTYHGIYSTTGTTSSDIQIQLQNRLLRLSSYTAQIAIANAGTEVPLNQWTHVAFCRSGSTVRLFNNGTQVGSATDSTTWATGAIQIGQVFGLYPLSGYMSNLRVVKGTAVYTANFTPPTTPLTAITNTSLLTCQSNRFIDNSTNAFAITANGDVSVQAFSPFNPTASWSAATYGGSGYFDGSGDYLQSSITALSGQFTVEFWVYRPSAGNNFLFTIGDSSASSGAEIYIGSSGAQLNYYSSNAVRINGGTPPAAGQWNYFAVTRDASNDVRLYANGVQVGSSYNQSGTLSTDLRVGAEYYGGAITGTLNGYMGAFRISNTVRTVTTVPTSLWQSDANTVFLANFTNAGIYDATSKNDLETVGNAQISTTQSKFGGSSMYFDGTGDSLDIVRSSNFVSNWDADFTIECWVYANNLSAQHIIFANVGTNSSGYNSAYINTNGSIGIGKAGVNEIASAASTFTSGQWNHLAFVRYGSNLNIYYNGVSVASTTSASTYLNSTIVGMAIGKNYQTTPAYMNGYIDDFRITKGIARYTSNFTPPTTAFLTL